MKKIIILTAALTFAGFSYAQEGEEEHFPNQKLRPVLAALLVPVFYLRIRATGAAWIFPTCRSRHNMNRPAPTIKAIPIHVEKFGHSLNKTMPQNIANGIATYSKGATRAASETLYAAEIR